MSTAAPFDQAFDLVANPRHGTPGVVVLNAAGFRRARREIESWPGHGVTPLTSLPAVAQMAGLAAVHIKDESPRFGLGSFKALGGAYAVLGQVLAASLSRGAESWCRRRAPPSWNRGTHRLARRASVTVTCATDGNHGRGGGPGAHAASAARCVIFVHETVSAGPRRSRRLRLTAPRSAVVPGTYDDAVRAAAVTAETGRLDRSSPTPPGPATCRDAALMSCRATG